MDEPVDEIEKLREREAAFRMALSQIARAHYVKGSEPQMLAMLQDMAVEALRKQHGNPPA